MYDITIHNDYENWYCAALDVDNGYNHTVLRFTIERIIAHELAHAIGPSFFRNNNIFQDDPSNHRTIIDVENQIAKELGKAGLRNPYVDDISKSPEKLRERLKF